MIPSGTAAPGSGDWERRESSGQRAGIRVRLTSKRKIPGKRTVRNSLIDSRFERQFRWRWPDFVQSGLPGVWVQKRLSINSDWSISAPRALRPSGGRGRAEGPASARVRLSLSFSLNAAMRNRSGLRHEPTSPFISAALFSSHIDLAAIMQPDDICVPRHAVFTCAFLDIALTRARFFVTDQGQRAGWKRFAG